MSSISAQNNGTNERREEFLQQAWRHYPAAESTWMSVRQFLLKNAAPAGLMNREQPCVCGRIVSISLASVRSEPGPTAAGGQVPAFLTLASDDQRMDLKFTEQTIWAASSLKSPASSAAWKFDASVLLEGDLISARISRAPQGGVQIDEISLLAPRRAYPSGAHDLAVLKSASPAFTSERARSWMRFLATIRTHFTEQDFIEAQTPTLVPSPGTEPFLDPFTTPWDFGARSRVFFLPTSPEFHLKKLLARGWSRVFEFKACFRNGEISAHHQPEFSMLEWYRAYQNLDAIADDVEALMQKLALEFSVPLLKLERTTMSELFASHFPGFELRADTTREYLSDLARAHGISTSATDTWDDLFFRIFLEKIEPGLGVEGPLLVRDYPPSQAALARIGANGFADRFEVYLKGMELANAFHELNDPLENEARFRADAQMKQQIGKPPVPVDEELIASVYQGLPPSGGIALGLDRLFMALMGITEIKDARAFAVQIEDSLPSR